MSASCCARSVSRPLRVCCWRSESLPGLAVPIFVAVPLWMLAAMVMAVRQALDYTSTVRAVAVCVFGWALAIALVLGAGFLAATPVG